MSFVVKYKWAILALIAVVGCVVDIYTKHLAATSLSMGHTVPVVGQYLQFLLVYNKGAIFGIDPRHYVPGIPMNLLFYIFSAIAIVILVVYYRALPKHDAVSHWGVAAILPGALGNLYDRVVHPQLGVVDFIRLGVSERIYWPIFNMADVYVTVGVGLILLSFLVDERRRVRAAAAVAPVTNAPPSGN